MRKIETTLYTIKELKELNYSAYERAIESVSVRRQEDFMEFSSGALLESMKQAARQFDMIVTNWSFGLYDYSYINVDIEQYMELDNEMKNDYVAWLNENLKDGMAGTCPFTGVCFDCYFFDAVNELTDGEGVTYNNLHKIVPEAIERGLKLALADEEATISNRDDCEEFAVEMDWEFTEDGEIYL